ncbi:hypothetical protein BUALT_Bualt05G0142200 [Buddleja alternifolia]|uniref:Uncharacterized protein n=1 Tax=Buddleja alternifolia TaxID=168488 RepID=A0AAV6XV82_9LAMI|nr:hypothetical protein BUALT_Bualt05G0142200 [Buddleja alternifolia]
MAIRAFDSEGTFRNMEYSFEQISEIRRYLEMWKSDYELMLQNWHNKSENKHEHQVDRKEVAAQLSSKETSFHQTQGVFDEMPETLVESLYSDYLRALVATVHDNIYPVTTETLQQVFGRFGIIEGVDILSTVENFQALSWKNSFGNGSKFETDVSVVDKVEFPYKLEYPYKLESPPFHSSVPSIILLESSIDVGILHSREDFAEFCEHKVPTEIVVQVLGELSIKELGNMSSFVNLEKLKPGEKLIRLHFKPAPYKGFEKVKDLFNVEAGRFTLLYNFSASLTSVNSFAKEFCISIGENQTPNIIFYPENSQSLDSGTYAFVNDIEIISVSKHLSYFHGRDLGAQVIRQKSLVYIDNTVALELIHKLNVKKGSVSSGDGSNDMLGL